MRPPLNNWQNIKFGYKFGSKTFYSNFHLGLDVIVPIGSTLFAPTNGSIIKAFTAPQGGNTIWFVDEDNRLWRFLHLSQMNPVKKYNEGDVIGLTGNSGSITSGSGHLHIDISKNGRLELENLSNFLDPLTFITQNIMNYENKIVRNSVNGEYSFVLKGVRRTITEERAGLAAITAIDRGVGKDDIITITENEYNKIQKGEDF